MADRRDITPELCRQLLRYEPETGTLFWRPRPVGMFHAEWQQRGWNTRYAGKEAFTADCGGGYRAGAIFDVKIRAHIVAWAIYYGVWPEHQVDHEDLDRRNNRIANLREATNSANMMNGSKRRDNTSGHKGVSWSKQRQKWVVTVSANKKPYHGGFHARLEDAVEARAELAARLHGEFARA